MTILAKRLAFILLLGTLYSARMNASTHTAATCSTSDVQAAINSTAGGDTVLIPAGTCAWTSGVTISGKGITLQGQGSGRIIAYSADTLTIGSGTKTINIANARVNGNLSITNAQTLTVSETGARSNFMTGTVTSYSGGILTMNITSTGGSGTTHRWLISTPPTTVIVNNSTSTTLFDITEDTNLHTNFGNIKIAAGTGAAKAVDLHNISGGRAVLIHDCWMETGASSGTLIHSTTNRGVIWNCSFDSSPFSMAPLAFQLQADSLTTSWSTASTMGTADTSGENNIYLENNDFHAYLNAGDIDNNGRAVIRYNLFNNAGFGSHGADTSWYGQRHFEYYNNTGVFNGYADGTTFNMNWWVWVRGGTYVIHHNTLPALVSTDYGAKDDVHMTVMNLQRSGGPDGCWGAGTTGGAAYHAPRQVGFGYVTGTGHDGMGRTKDGYAYVGDSEPAYIWANSRQPLTNVGIADFGGTQCANPAVSTNYIVAGRDYLNSSTAKPGYTPFTYPHPLTGSGTGTAVAPPTALHTTVN